MKWLVVITLLLGTEHIYCHDQSTDVFIFGEDKGKIIFNKGGSIGPWHKDKITRVAIDVPFCMKLQHVRVTVDNKVGPPVVSIDWDQNLAIIKYRKLQYSTSNYHVVAKALPEKSCMDLQERSTGK